VRNVDKRHSVCENIRN